MKYIVGVQNSKVVMGPYQCFFPEDEDLECSVWYERFCDYDSTPAHPVIGTKEELMQQYPELEDSDFGEDE